jgi:hypothetical protein
MTTSFPTAESLTTDLDPWLGLDGPVATVVLSTPSATEEARDRLRIESKNARDRLEGQVSDETLAAFDEALSDPRTHAAGDGLLVFEGHGQAAVVPLTGVDDDTQVWTGTLPRFGPLLAARQAAVPHVVVIADRGGADMEAVGPRGEHDEESVEGDREHIARSSPGGWSQRRFQQRAENTWEKNAAEVAAEVDRLRADVGARVVIAAGDERALQFLRDHASSELAEVLQFVDGAGRNDPNSFAEVADDVRRALKTVAAADTVAVLEHFQEVRSRGEAVAADGPDETLSLLSQGRVATLLVHDDPDDDRTACFDPASGQVATTAATLRALDLEAREGRLVDVAVWAALRTGADVHLVPGRGPNSPTGGLGALLRG